ncbi:transcriptional regulator [Ureibacillus endophyticus]|uniref:Transcriptional regulator n=1 Tax=Ureibacillus endophyticus TaxID=1978490 RepID=A0A494YVK7_9BACL|nr:transcriptional regulator [Lysinibacillus endophyticus]RKQ14203.1 transcriptional regulator [Lysinibacillus endophyticus]
MKEKLLKVLKRNLLIDMMYIDQNNVITKRRIKVAKITGNTIRAYCFTRHANRTFTIENILAFKPVIRKERDVI